MTAFIFAHLLQVVGELGQGRGTLAHQIFEAAALFTLDFLFTLVDIFQGVGLAQVHVKRQQANHGHGGNAQAG